VAGLDFVDASHGFAAGNGYVYRTTDGGDTWTNLGYLTRSYTDETGAIYTAQVRSVDFLDANTGWAVGDNGLILSYEP